MIILSVLIYTHSGYFNEHMATFATIYAKLLWPWCYLAQYILNG
jgi:hypothetical protein